MSEPPHGEPQRGPAPEVRIGLDTGGTYTDAVALDGGRQVVASAKALTTHWDLAIGLGNAMRAVLTALPAALGREHIKLVSVSTTLATNAVVENRHKLHHPGRL
jgi:N-methylhydantoinase A/oxoprolinase/acetone carboxylase beta subunit